MALSFEYAANPVFDRLSQAGDASYLKKILAQCVLVEADSRYGQSIGKLRVLADARTHTFTK